MYICTSIQNATIPDVDVVAASHHVGKLIVCTAPGLQLVADWLVTLPPGARRFRRAGVNADHSVLARRRHLHAIKERTKTFQQYTTVE